MCFLFVLTFTFGVLHREIKMSVMILSEATEMVLSVWAFSVFCI